MMLENVFKNITNAYIITLSQSSAIRTLEFLSAQITVKAAVYMIVWTFLVRKNKQMEEELEPISFSR